MLKKNYSGQFKKDYKAAIKRKLNIDLLDNVIRHLCVPSALREKYKDHLLSGNWAGHRVCHIQPD